METRKIKPLDIIIFVSVAGALAWMWFDGKGMRDLRESGELVVLTRNAPTTYYHGRHGLAGFEYDLTQSFADYLNINVQYKTYESVGGLLQAIRSNEGHLVAAGITHTAERGKSMDFTGSYQQVRQQLVCQPDIVQPQTPADMVDKNIAVIAQSSYEETLRQWQKEYPKIKWQGLNNIGTEQLLLRVIDGELDCTIADSNIVDIARRFNERIEPAFDATKAQNLAWVMAPHTPRQLKAEFDNWLAKFKASGDYDVTYQRYFGFSKAFDFVDMRVFTNRIQKRLPRYRQIFEQAALSTNIPWTVLAAQAYQESNWNAKADSPAGGAGMMLLDAYAAESLGVKDVFDAQQSVTAVGMRLAELLEKVPDEVVKDERLWYAIAAYHLGIQHIDNALKLAKQQGLNPHNWEEMVTVLPLLADKMHYPKLEYGYAPGHETVLYVQRIRDFQKTLERHLGASS